MDKLKGSMTVEAALILPLTLLVFGTAMNAGLKMYQECRGTAEEVLEEREWDVIKKFYLWNELGEMWEDGD